MRFEDTDLEFIRFSVFDVIQTSGIKTADPEKNTESDYTGFDLGGDTPNDLTGSN